MHNNKTQIYTCLVKLPQSVAEPKTSDLFVIVSITVDVNLYCTNDKADHEHKMR